VLMDWQMPGMDGIEAGRRIKQHMLLKTIPAIIMVSAYGRVELRDQADEIGLDGYLVKPVNHSMLFDSIMFSFGEKTDQKIEIKGTDIVVADHVRGAHLLLVEDNEINQQVAQELLEKAGLVVTIANNGQECLDELERSLFDGVLMDLQMPVMGGIEATAIIRKQEKFKDLPVIAMTANAMAGDRDACIEAGMNDHIAKPIELAELFGTLNHWITAKNPVNLEASAIEMTDAELPDIPELDGIDIDSGIQRVGGNRKLYRNILMKFRNSQAHVVAEIEAAVAASDLDTATRVAHTLKGVAGNISANELQAAALNLESALKAGKTDGLEPLYEIVESELSRVLASTAVLKIDEAEDKRVTQTVDIALTQPILDELGTLLEDDDTDAEECLDRLEQTLKGTGLCSEALNQMRNSIGQYDFEEALVALAAIQSNIGAKHE